MFSTGEIFLLSTELIASILFIISSTINQKYITLVISHEIVHQWFGNLVTLQWWNDLWYFYNSSREKKKIKL